MSIKLPSGDLVKADREVAYAFGHWMGLADMAYCMDGGKLRSLNLFLQAVVDVLTVVLS